MTRLGLGLRKQWGLGLSPKSGAAPSPPYVAKAVHFDGATMLSIVALTATDNGFFSFSMWLREAGSNGPTVWVADPAGAYANAMFITSDIQINPRQVQISLGNGADSLFCEANNYPLPNDAWHSIIGTATTNLGAGSKIEKLYVDGVDVTDITSDAGASFTNLFNGLSFYLGNDTFDDWFTGDLADVRIMPGTSLLTGTDIDPATLALFVNASNKPVDPAVATASLGAPCILFSGDASAFATNLGIGGPFTLTGTITNASTSPSD